MFLTVKPYLPTEKDYDPDRLLIPADYQKTMADCCEMKVRDRQLQLVYNRQSFWSIALTQESPLDNSFLVKTLRIFSGDNRFQLQKTILLETLPFKTKEEMEERNEDDADVTYNCYPSFL